MRPQCRLGRRRVVWAAVWAFFSMAPALRASLVGPSIHDIAVGPDEVVVRIRSRLLFFDHEGAFQRELTISDLPIERSRLAGFTADGRLWLTTEERGQGEAVETTLSAIDGNGEVLVQHRLSGERTFSMTRGGRAFTGRLEAQQEAQPPATPYVLVIEGLDLVTGHLSTPQPRIPIETPARVLDLGSAPAVSWAANDRGEVFVLTTEEESGRVTLYKPSGEAVRSWDVKPDPITSVSYVRDLFLDHEGTPYVTHSSWEVSSAVGNDGSVLRLALEDGEPLRFKEGIGYLQHAAVAPSGDVFVTDLSEEVARFSRAGERVLSWVAVPPRFGESWEERRRRIADAQAIGPDSETQALLNAVVYGRHQTARAAARWLLARGASVVAEVTTARLHFDKWSPLDGVASQVWTAHPLEVVRLFADSGDPVRRLLAPFLAWNVHPAPDGVREVLGRMALEGNSDARHALDEIGPTAEVIHANLAALSDLGQTSDRAFDAEWSLKRTYPWSVAALEDVLRRPDAPARERVRALILEASRELMTGYGPPQKQPVAIPEDVIRRTRSWVASPDRVVHDTGVIALTSLGVAGHEDDAIAAARDTPALLGAVLRAFAVLAKAHPQAVATRAESLVALAVAFAPTSRYGDDPLRELVAIRSPAVAGACLRLVRDDSLPLERRCHVLYSLDAGALARPAVLDLLRDEAWRQSLFRESFGGREFLQSVQKAYASDVEMLAELKSLLLTLLTGHTEPNAGGAAPATAEEQEAGEDAERSALHTKATAMQLLAPVITAADLPSLVSLLDEPGFDVRLRPLLLRLLSQVPPDAALQARMRPLLENPELALFAATSLGRAGHRAALDVLVEQGLKRLGSYSSIQLDVESFRPIGADAEQTLLSLLDYPNRGTQEAVRLFLMQWPSQEGRRRILAELRGSVDAGRAPEPFTLDALAAVGEDVAQPLLTLALDHPEALDDLGCCGAGDAIAAQLRQRLASESEPSRVLAVRQLLKRFARYEDR